MSCRSFGYGSVGVYPSPALTVERQGRCQGGPAHSPVRDTQPVNFPSLPTLCACLLQHCPGQSTHHSKERAFLLSGPWSSKLTLTPLGSATFLLSLGSQPSLSIAVRGIGAMVMERFTGDPYLALQKFYICLICENKIII